MTDPPAALPLPATLLERLRAVEPKIAWRDAPRPAGRRGPAPRIAHLFQEEATVVRRGRGARLEMRVDAGPLGALLLLLEADRRATAPRLVSLPAERDPLLPGGAFVARWGDGPDPPGAGRLSAAQLVELARYALA